MYPDLPQPCLAASVSAEDTTIPITTTVGFPKSGVVVINPHGVFHEVVSFHGIENGRLLGVCRGVEGSAVMGWPAGTDVYCTATFFNEIDYSLAKFMEGLL